MACGCKNKVNKPKVVTTTKPNNSDKPKITYTKS